MKKKEIDIQKFDNEKGTNAYEYRVKYTKVKDQFLDSHELDYRRKHRLGSVETSSIQTDAEVGTDPKKSKQTS